MAHHASWLDRAVDILKRQPGPPPKPATRRSTKASGINPWSGRKSSPA
jgi:hypothetical protein